MIHPIGVGCWAFGGGNYWGNQSQEDAEYIVAQALDRGLNFFDTAAMYNDGRSEESLGKALKGHRSRAIVTTKVSPALCSKDALIKSCEESMGRLQTDYIDLYMIHWPINPISVRHFTKDTAIINNPPTVAEAFATLDYLKKQGKIRAIGISNFGPSQLEEALATGVQIDVNEITYNLFSRAIERDIIPACIKHNVSIIASMALQQGLLAGIYKTAGDVPPPQAHSRHYHWERGGTYSRHTSMGAEVEMFAALDEIIGISKELSAEVSQLAIAWILAKKGLAGVLVGSRNLEELDSNIKASGLILPPYIIARLDEITMPVLTKLGYSPDYYEDEEDSRIC